jgi:hypothetical protein
MIPKPFTQPLICCNFHQKPSCGRTQPMHRVSQSRRLIGLSRDSQWVSRIFVFLFGIEPIRNPITQPHPNCCPMVLAYDTPGIGDAARACLAGETAAPWNHRPAQRVIRFPRSAFAVHITLLNLPSFFCSKPLPPLFHYSCYFILIVTIEAALSFQAFVHCRSGISRIFVLDESSRLSVGIASAPEVPILVPWKSGRRKYPSEWESDHSTLDVPSSRSPSPQ